MYIQEIALTVSQKTKDYLHIVDDKLSEYKEFIQNKLNCVDCLKDLLSKISNLEKIKESIINESKAVLNGLEGLDLKERLDELNEKLMRFKDELIEKLESSEMEWIDIYRNSEKMKDRKIKRWPLFIMLLGAVACLGGSTCFHLFAVHSQKWFEFLSRLDYAGISLLILGSCYPPYYYYLYCREGKNNFYI